ncbi:sensor histidine kinase [Nitratireductor sp. StC3]|nr:sensor histidine kinase [Nitratireductor sp. StC3]
MSLSSNDEYRRPGSLLLLAAFLAVVIGVGTLIGSATVPGAWYAGLQKPPFSPPNWIFGPVWFTLYVLIAIAGWRTFLADHDGTAMKLWYGQMALNWLWSPVFFALHLVWPAFVVIVAMALLVVGFAVNRWRADRLAAALFVPYAAWVGFAALLNLSIAILN